MDAEVFHEVSVSPVVRVGGEEDVFKMVVDGPTLAPVTDGTVLAKFDAITPLSEACLQLTSKAQIICSMLQRM